MCVPTQNKFLGENPLHASRAVTMQAGLQLQIERSSARVVPVLLTPYNTITSRTVPPFNLQTRADSLNDLIYCHPDNHRPIFGRRSLSRCGGEQCSRFSTLPAPKQSFKKTTKGVHVRLPPWSPKHDKKSTAKSHLTELGIETGT